MNKESKNEVKRFRHLRQMAQEKLWKNGNDMGQLADKDANYLLEELKVHQIELEMQNEELKKSERELTEARDKFSDLYYNAPVGYATFDSAGRVHEANNTLVNKLGVDRQAVIGKLFSDHIAREFQDQFYFFCRHISGQGKQTVELELKARDGAVLHVIINGMALLDSERNSAVFRAAIIDITDLKQAVDRIHEHQLTIERMEAIEKANQEIDDLTYLVSENLRSPVRYIAGFADALREEAADKLNERENHYLERISNASKQLGHVLDSLTRLSQLTRGKIYARQVNLSKIIETAIQEARALNPEIKFKTRITPDIFALADGLYIEHALDNLVSYISRLPVSQDPVTIVFETSRKDGKISYCLAAEGINISPDMGSALFEPYKHGRKTPSESSENMNIPLTVTKRIIVHHGGQIWVESESKDRIEFCFTL